MKQVDLVIAGASFAGLACAKTAAERGLKVVVLEKKTDITRAIHTTGILVKEAAGLLEVPDRLVRRITDIRLYAPSLRYVDLASRDYFFLATDTPGLMTHMADRTRAVGAEIMFGTAFTGAEQTDSEVILQDHELVCRYLIGADGARSRVAEIFNLARATGYLAGAEIEYHGATVPNEDAFYCFLDQARAFGYLGWVVPGLGITQIGLAARMPARPNLDGFVARLSPLFGLDKARIVGRRGGLIPISGLVRPAARGRVILVGDAAGMVSPFSAGGIHLSLHYGALLGAAVAADLGAKGLHPAKVIAGSEPRFAFKSVLRWVYEHLAADWLLNHVVASAPFRKLAAIIFFKEKRLP